jgi:hypothetical protein
MSISLSNDIRLAIMRELERVCEEHDVTNTSDVDLAQIEDAIHTVMFDFGWVGDDEAWEAAQDLASDFDGVEVGAGV